MVVVITALALSNSLTNILDNAKLEMLSSGEDAKSISFAFPSVAHKMAESSILYVRKKKSIKLITFSLSKSWPIKTKLQKLRRGCQPVSSLIF